MFNATVVKCVNTDSVPSPDPNELPSPNNSVSGFSACDFSVFKTKQLDC